MSDLTHTIKLIMDYIAKKESFEMNSNINPQHALITIKKDFFFKNHMGKSLEQIYKNNKLDNLYTNYCKNNFTKKMSFYINE